MGRRRWQGTKEQEQHIAKVVREFDASREHDEAGWEAAQKARKLGIPDTVLCQRADLSRTTFQRRLGPRPGESDDPGE